MKERHRKTRNMTVFLVLITLALQFVVPSQLRSEAQTGSSLTNGSAASNRSDKNSLGTSQSSLTPVERSASFTFTNRTVPEYPTFNSLVQKSAPANGSLLSEMVSLTVAQPSSWRNFSLSTNEKFLAIDGASQGSGVLPVLIEVYSPGSGLRKALNTTYSQPLHYIERNPTLGEWGIHMSLTETGNTTVWIQAISSNRGTKDVTGYHKELSTMIPGQAEYFKIPLASNDWVDIHSQRLAGGYVTFETYLPTYDFTNSWQSSYNSYDSFLASTEAPQLGTYLFIARDYEGYGDRVDIVIQITKKAAVAKTLFPNSGFSLRFNMTSENEYYYVDLNKTYQWLALDGGVLNDGWARYCLRGPSMSPLATLDVADPYDYPVSTKPIQDPPTGKCLLVIQGSGRNVVCTVQITVSGIEEISLSTKQDLALHFQQTGQTLYYSINTTERPFFIFSGSSEIGRTIYRLFDFRNEEIWNGDSWSPSSVQPTLQIPVGNKCMLSIQSYKSSVALIHLRFKGDFDYSASFPDYSDLGLRFSGDFLMYRLNVPDVSYIVQYWYNLAPSFVYGEVYDAGYTRMTALSLPSQGSESRLIWRKNMESFTPGNWTIFVTGEKCQYVRVSQLRAGNEERTANSPFHVFETFEFDHQAKTFLVNVPRSIWFSTIAATQTSSSSYLRVFDSKLNGKQDINISPLSALYFYPWQNPETGNWLLIIDGSMSTNVSLTFRSSVDVPSSRLNGQHYTDEFTYYGDGHYYFTNVSNSSFLGLDVMGMAEGLQTCLYLVDPMGQVQYYAYSASKFDVNHYPIPDPTNGTWFIILVGSPGSKVIYRATTMSDQYRFLPFTDSYTAGFNGKVTYISFKASNTSTLLINITSNVASDSWLWLYMPDGQLWSEYYDSYTYHFTGRGEVYPINIGGAPDGEWRICLIQEIYANLTISAGNFIPPPPPPSGIFVRFVYPPDAQLYNINGTQIVLPEINGTINVVVNVTDYYHSIWFVQLYYNEKTDYADMPYNPSSGFYETWLDTTIFPDGICELVVFAQCWNYETRFQSICIRVNNNGTLPPIDDVTPPIISEVHQDPPSYVLESESVLVWASVADRDTAVSLVILSYSTDDGLTWKNITMSQQDKVTFKAHIPGCLAGTKVMYAIIAYDYVQNRALENDAGSYYVYTVVPELSGLHALLMLMLATLAGLIVCKRKQRICLWED